MRSSGTFSSVRRRFDPLALSVVFVRIGLVAIGLIVIASATDLRTWFHRSGTATTAPEIVADATSARVPATSSPAPRTPAPAVPLHTTSAPEQKTTSVALPPDGHALQPVPGSTPASPNSESIAASSPRTTDAHSAASEQVTAASPPAVADNPAAAAPPSPIPDVKRVPSTPKDVVVSPSSTEETKNATRTPDQLVVSSQPDGNAATAQAPAVATASPAPSPSPASENVAISSQHPSNITSSPPALENISTPTPHVDSKAEAPPPPDNVVASSPPNLNPTATAPESVTAAPPSVEKPDKLAVVEQGVPTAVTPHHYKTRHRPAVAFERMRQHRDLARNWAPAESSIAKLRPSRSSGRPYPPSPFEKLGHFETGTGQNDRFD